MKRPRPKMKDIRLAVDWLAEELESSIKSHGPVSPRNGNGLKLRRVQAIREKYGLRD